MIYGTILGAIYIIIGGFVGAYFEVKRKWRKPLLLGAVTLFWPSVLCYIIYHELTRKRYVRKIILGKLLFPDSLTSWCPLLYVPHQDPPGGYLNEQWSDTTIGPGWFCVIVNVDHLGVQNMNRALMQGPVLAEQDTVLEETKPEKPYDLHWGRSHVIPRRRQP